MEVENAVHGECFVREEYDGGEVVDEVVDVVFVWKKKRVESEFEAEGIGELGETVAGSS